jgi:hypothetical protein
VTCLPADLILDEGNLAAIRAAGYSRIPVCRPMCSIVGAGGAVTGPSTTIREELGQGEGEGGSEAVTPPRAQRSGSGSRWVWAWVVGIGTVWEVGGGMYEGISTSAHDPPTRVPNTHTHARTNARAHTHAHTHTPSTTPHGKSHRPPPALGWHAAESVCGYVLTKHLITVDPRVRIFFY